MRTFWLLTLILSFGGLLSACAAKHGPRRQSDASQPAEQPTLEPSCVRRGGCIVDAAAGLGDAGSDASGSRLDASVLPYDAASAPSDAGPTDAAPDVITLSSSCVSTPAVAHPASPSCTAPALGANVLVDRDSRCDASVEVGSLSCAQVGSDHFAIAYPGDGSVLVLGGSPGWANPGCGALPDGTRSFVARFAADGTCQWSTPIVVWQRFGKTPLARAFAISPQGEIVVTGEFSGPVEIGGVHVDTGDPGRSHYFLVRMTLAGSVSSVQQVAVNAVFWEPLLPAFDARGRLYVAGNSRVQVGFSPECIATMPDAHSAWLAELDPQGQPRWIRSLSAYQLGGFVAVDDELLLAGSDGADLFVRSFAQTGGDRWQTRFAISHASGNTWFNALAVSPKHIALGGSLAQGISVGVSTLQGHGGFGEAFIAQLNRSGTPLRARLFPLLEPDDAGLSQTYLRGLAFASDGALLATGGFSGTTSVGGPPLHTFRPGEPTTFAALFDEQLEPQASARFSGYPAGLLLACDGAVYLGTGGGVQRLR